MMKPRLMIIAMLSGVLAFGAQAAPISYLQIRSEQDMRQSVATNTTAVNKEDAASKVVNVTNESLDQPEFVRLSDGRLIPYGPGVICSDACVESEIVQPNRKWWIAVPLVGGAVLVGALLAGNDSIPGRPSIVDNTTQNPTPTPTPVVDPTPNPSPTPNDKQPEPVPEPATIALLGTGLALMARKVKKVRSERN